MIKLFFNTLVFLSLLVSTPTLAADEKWEWEGLNILLPMPTTGEFLDDCKAAIKLAQDGKRYEFFRNNCFAFAHGLSMGETLAVAELKDAIEYANYNGFCFQTFYEPDNEGKPSLTSFVELIKTIVLVLETKIKSEPRFKDVPAQDELLLYNDGKLCLADKHNKLKGNP